MPKTDPMNPFAWVRGVQNWFGRTERSSGFRPYLIYLIIVLGFALVLLFWFPNNAPVQGFAVNILYAACGLFMLIFAIKAFTDPDFCRSEKHIQTLRKLDLEKLGSDIKQADAEVIEMELSNESAPETRALKGGK